VTRIYLDHAATTAMRPEAVEAFRAHAQGYNPSSVHAEGRAARAQLDAARETVARVLGAAPREVVFTGSGSEADVLAVTGAARALAARGRHVVTTVIEHHAVLHAFDVLEAEGWTVTRVPVDARGLLDPERFAAALRGDTTLASVMLANNEIGTIQPVAELARIAHARGVTFHTDAIQAPAWLAVRPGELGVDVLSLSGHKFEGPKGAGVLYVRRGTPLAPLVVGGGQEHGLRAGTENVAGATAFAAALALAESERAETAARAARLRDRLEDGIVRAVPGARVNGRGAPRLPNVASIAFAGAASDALVIRLDLEGIAVSAGSACAAGSVEPSHVVAALGLDEELRRGVVRFSLGRLTTESEIDEVLRRLPGVLADVRTPLAV
jgi:cysteine desulfurase